MEKIIKELTEIALKVKHKSHLGRFDGVESATKCSVQLVFVASSFHFSVLDVDIGILPCDGIDFSHSMALNGNFYRRMEHCVCVA